MGGAMRSFVRVFAALFALLLIVLGAGWYALTLSYENPVPYSIMSAWHNMVSVGLAVEYLLGHIPADGRSLSHAALVVGSAALVWALLFIVVFAGVAWCVRMARRLT